MLRNTALFFAALFTLVPLAFAEDETDGFSRKELIKACRSSKNLLRSMDLSDTQKADLDAALESYLAESELLREERREASKAVSVEMYKHDDNYDEETLASLIDNRAALNKEIGLMKAQVLTEVQAILSDQQYRKFLKSRAALFVCTQGPRSSYNRVIGGFLGRN